jgi:hypothetical protein
VISVKMTPSYLSGQKKYSKKTVYEAHLASKKHIKAAAREAESGLSNKVDEPAKGYSAAPSTKASRVRNSALYTFLVTSLLLHHSVTLVCHQPSPAQEMLLQRRRRKNESITPSNFRLAGTGSRYHTGCTSSMASVLSTAVRSVRTMSTWDGACDIYGACLHITLTCCHPLMQEKLRSAFSSKLTIVSTSLLKADSAHRNLDTLLA